MDRLLRAFWTLNKTKELLEIAKDLKSCMDGNALGFSRGLNEVVDELREIKEMVKDLGREGRCCTLISNNNGSAYRLCEIRLLLVRVMGEPAAGWAPEYK